MRKVYTTEVHLVQWEVRPEVPCEPRQEDDGPLEPYGCSDVPSVPIKPEGPRTKIVR